MVVHVSGKNNELNLAFNSKRHKIVEHLRCFLAYAIGLLFADAPAKACELEAQMEVGRMEEIGGCHEVAP
jgi:hypothetical protein